jgi:hypothetical protein
MKRSRSSRGLLLAALSLFGGAEAGCGGPAMPAPPVASVASTPPPPAVDPPSGSDAGVATGSDSAAPPTMAPSPVLVRLSQDWAKDTDLAEHHPEDDIARCPRAHHDLLASNVGLAPAPFVRLEGIATHACDAVLWVFLSCTQATDDGTACQDWKERLVLEPIASGAARVVGDIQPIHGGNSGGLFVPFAFARDDRTTLLRAWMFSPGAGGGAVDYGIGTVATSTDRGPAPIDVQPLVVRDLSFYADDGCAVGLAGSPKTPTYSQPGFPSNNGGALVALNLATLKPRTLLEEKDTTYVVQQLNEKAGTLDLEVAHHTFGKDCPREEGALSCSKATRTRRTIVLPPCAKP